MTSVSLRSRPSGFESGSHRAGPVQRLKRVVQYRRILALLVRRDLKVRYAGSILGYVWTVLDPLLLSVVYWFVFTQVFARGNANEDPYILFIVMGQLLWAMFNGGVGTAARALRAEAQMVRSSNVPRELWVLRVVCSKMVEYVFALPVMAIFALAYLKEPNWHLVFLPVALALVFMLTTGLGLLLAPLNIMVRDTERLVPIILRVMFYLSPVLYSIDTVIQRVPSIGVIYGFNPMVGPLSLARSGFFPAELKWGYIWHSMVMCPVIFAIGLYAFMRLERQVLKEI